MAARRVSADRHVAHERVVGREVHATAIAGRVVVQQQIRTGGRLRAVVVDPGAVLRVVVRDGREPDGAVARRDPAAAPRVGRLPRHRRVVDDVEVLDVVERRAADPAARPVGRDTVADGQVGDALAWLVEVEDAVRAIPVDDGPALARADHLAVEVQIEIAPIGGVVEPVAGQGVDTGVDEDCAVAGKRVRLLHSGAERAPAIGGPAPAVTRVQVR